MSAAAADRAQPAVLDRRLGAFEEAMILTQEYSPFNVIVALRLRPAPPLAAVRTALDVVQREQPALRCAVAGRPGRRRFVPVATPLPLTVDEEGDATPFLAAVTEELARELPLAEGPLLHVRHRRRAGEAELLLTFPHAIVDAASGVALVDRLLQQVAGAAGSAAPVPPLPFLPARFPARFRGPAGRLRALAALARGLGSEMSFQLRTRGAGLAGIDRQARSRVLAIELDEAATATAVGAARRAGVTLNSALCAAFLLAARHRLRHGKRLPARLFTMADLRRWVDPPLDAGTLGAGWAMMRFVVEPAPGEDVWTLARAINEQIGERLRRGEKYLAYRTILPMMRIGLGGRRFRMGEMAISHVGPAPIAQRYGDYEVPELQVFVSNIDLGPEYIVQSRLRGGRLGWGIVYLDTDMSGELARAVAEEAAALLVAAARREEVR
ncbi:MAG: phthiocerol/phthiodiolone dimycocerosyl transferase family protein [Acidobacteriota bacterium]